MRKSKVIEVLKTFSEEELKKFKDFVYSPFHNKNKNVIKLFDYLRKYFPAFDSDKLEKQKIYTKLFPGKKYNDVVIRILISDLLRLSEEYLAYINYQKEPLNELKDLLDELKERKLDSLHKSNLNIAEKILNQPGKINYRYYFELFDFETSRIDFLIDRDEQKLTSSSVLKQGEYLLNFFIIGIFNIAHELTTHKDVLNVTFDFNLVEEALSKFDLEGMLKYMKENNYKHYPILLIYYNMYLSCIHPEKTKYYYEMKSLIDKNIILFDRSEMLNLYIILETTCLTHISLGKFDFYKELLEIYKQMLKHNIYLHSFKDYFQVNLFRNMFFTGIVLKEYEWSEKFLEDYIDKLSPVQREDMSHYSKAILNFEKGDYEKAL